jgi:Domain of unknown function (DUF4386)
MATTTDNDRCRRGSANIQAWARVAGLLFVATLLAGGFGEGYVPGALIAGHDAAATVANLKAHDTMYRLSFAAYLIEALCDVGIAVIFYVLLEPAGRVLALMTVFLGVLSTATFAACEIFYFGLPQLLLRGSPYLGTFSPAQLATLTLLSLKLFSYGGGLFTVFYGTGWILRGILMMRSGYFPRILAVLMMIGGLGFVLSNAFQVLAPQYQTQYLLFAFAPGGILLGLWLLIRGVDLDKWQERAAAPST